MSCPKTDSSPVNFIPRIYELLEAHFGPTHWWPGETPFEVAIGAILTQNTAWVNVEKAIANLKAADLLSPRVLLDCPDAALEDAIRPSGYFRVKAIRLRAFCAWLMDRCGGDMEVLALEPLASLRPALLAINGIGPETCDDILLYACGKPVFVVDAYTRRICGRHGVCPETITYHALQELFESALPRDLHLFKEYHGLIVYTGKEFCRRVPKCGECPLGVLLASGAAHPAGAS